MRGIKDQSKLDYSNLSMVEVYDHLVAGTILKFPNGYINKQNMKELLREVILNRHKLSREDICNKLSYEYLKKHNLGGSRKAFDSNMYKLISYCFPEFQIKQWELRKVSDGFWEDENNRKEFMEWVCEKENINVDSLEDLKRIDARMIQKHGGSKALRYGGGLYNLITLIAETEVKEWQVIKMPVWTKQKVAYAVKWMIEEKLKWSEEDVIRKISASIFYEYDLGGLLSKYCDHSPIRALQVAYPGQYTKVRNSRPEYLRKK